MSVSYGGDSITFADGSVSSSGWTGFKNRIINGAMIIDQRNAGASITSNSGSANSYSVDRFRTGGGGGTWGTGVVTTQQTTDAPAGFYNSTKVTVTTADASLSSGDGYAFLQGIEANNVSDLKWGTSSASPVTLSFWVKSSVAGVHSGSIAHGGSTFSSYTFTFTLLADTWTYVTKTVPGSTINNTPTTGNLAGMYVFISLGGGTGIESTEGTWTQDAGVKSRVSGAVNLISTNAATLNITGVQLEKGSTASSFEYRPYGTELHLCQRYYQKMSSGGTGITASTSTVDFSFQLPVPMRASASVSLGANLTITDSVASDFTQSSINLVDGQGWTTNDGSYAHLRFSNFTGLTNYRAYLWRNPGNPVLFSAEF